MMIPTVIHTYESQTLMKRNKLRIYKHRKLKYLRSLSGYSLMGNKRNENIKKEVNILNWNEKII
jgi:hypothetical protein